MSQHPKHLKIGKKLNARSNVWYQATYRENGNPFPVTVLEVKDRTALIKYTNLPNAAPFRCLISSLYNPY